MKIDTNIFSLKANKTTFKIFIILYAFSAFRQDINDTQIDMNSYKYLQFI
jgi:hypothetical protein